MDTIEALFIALIKAFLGEEDSERSEHIMRSAVCLLPLLEDSRGEDGGHGSGNFNHRGRPGRWGGSQRTEGLGV